MDEVGSHAADGGAACRHTSAVDARMCSDDAQDYQREEETGSDSGTEGDAEGDGGVGGS